MNSHWLIGMTVSNICSDSEPNSSGEEVEVSSQQMAIFSRVMVSVNLALEEVVWAKSVQWWWPAIWGWQLRDVPSPCVGYIWVLPPLLQWWIHFHLGYHWCCGPELGAAESGFPVCVSEQRHNWWTCLLHHSQAEKRWRQSVGRWWTGAVWSC